MEYSLRHVSRILRFFGMKYAKPYPKDYRRPENAEEEFKKLEEIELENCIIGFLDETSPQLASNTQRLWSFNKPSVKKNTTKMIDRAHMILPYHQLLDGLQEKIKGKLAAGTTKRGIGPTYADKMNRIGLRMGDLKDFSLVKEKLDLLFQYKLPIFEKYNIEYPSPEEVLKKLEKIKDRLIPMIRDTSLVLNEALDSGKWILAEGAQGKKVMVGAFTYRETGVSGEFGRYLTRALSSALSQAGISLLKKDPEHRGAWLSGKYWESGDEVVVYAELEGPGGEVTSLQRSIAKDKVPYELRPALAEEMEPLMGKGGHGLKLALWTDKGRKPSYQEGEQMVAFLKADRDCYVQLIYHDAEGRDFLIFPKRFRRDNFIKAGKVYQIPGPGDRFRFTVSPPFGTEVLKAFASTEPVPLPQGKFVGGGLLMMSGSTKEVVERLKRSIRASARWAEASCPVNTMPAR